MRHARKGVLVETGDACDSEDWARVKEEALRRKIWDNKNGEVVFFSPPWGLLKRDAPDISAKEAKDRASKGLQSEPSEDEDEDDDDDDEDDILSKGKKGKDKSYCDVEMTKRDMKNMAANIAKMTNPAAVVVLHLHPGLFPTYTKSFENSGWTVFMCMNTIL